MLNVFLGCVLVFNKVIICWGTTSNITANVTQTIQLPISFTTNTYFAYTVYTARQNGYVLRTTSQTTTKFVSDTDNFASSNPRCARRWIAIGY